MINAVVEMNQNMDATAYAMVRSIPNTSVKNVRTAKQMMQGRKVWEGYCLKHARYQCFECIEQSFKKLENEIDVLRKTCKAVLQDAVPCEESENPKQYVITTWSLNNVLAVLESTPKVTKSDNGSTKLNREEVLVSLETLRKLMAISGATQEQIDPLYPNENSIEFDPIDLNDVELDIYSQKDIDALRKAGSIQNKDLDLEESEE